MQVLLAVLLIFLVGAPLRADDETVWRAKVVEANGYLNTGNFRMAQELLNQTVREIEAKTPGSPLMAATLNNLGLVYEALGDALKAERSFMRSVAILKSRSDVTERDRARPLNNLAILYLELGVEHKLKDLRLEELAEKLETLEPQLSGSTDHTGESGRIVLHSEETKTG